MARPIKETPVLKGKEAVKFLAEQEKSKNIKASQAEIDRIKQNYQKLNTISDFR